jgi:predicted metal-binding membrane protein
MGWPVEPAAPLSMGLWPRVQSQKLFLGSLAALITLAWVALWLLGQSPAGRLGGAQPINGHHGATAGFFCVIGGAGSRHPTLVMFFVVGWILMIAAMMLPTSLPLIAFFHALTRARPNRGILIGLLLAGYLLVWAGFAVLVHLGDLGAHSAADRLGWLGANAWAAAAIFALAGLYQFSSLKYRCLDKCRSPVSFVMQHWRGGAERRQALRLGLDHGLFCLGCCWSLMLLMFAVGVGSLGWMFGLAAIMAAEKNAPWGRRLTAPLGVALLLAAVTLAAAGASGVQLLGGG